MWQPRIALVGASFWLAALLTGPGAGFAQSGADRQQPPRLTGTPQSTGDPPGGPPQRRPAPPFTYFDPYLVGSDGYAYPDDSAGPVPDTAWVAAEEASVARAGGALADTLLVDQIGPKNLVRLTWRDPSLSAAQVAFFLADSSRAVLSAQTVRSPPFTALFEPPPRSAFAGMTVVLPDGRLVTRLVPYRRQTR